MKKTTETETETVSNTPKSHENEAETRETVLPLWASREAVCAALGISRATFYRRVKAGVIESQKVGRDTRYHVVSAVRQSQKTVRLSHETETETRETETETRETETETFELVDGVDDSLTELVGQVATLTAKLSELERERHEAILTGHQIANQRDEAVNVLTVARRDCDALRDVLSNATTALARANEDVRLLQKAVERLTDGVAAVSGAFAAVPVRRRLMAILAGA